MARKILVSALAGVAMACATPALAQGRSGGHGGGPGGGMGAGPPMTPPGQMGAGMGTPGYASDIASQRGQFGRDFAEQQRLQAQQYRAQAEQRRAEALAYAQAARSGRPLPANAAGKIRSALKADIDAWREAFDVGRRDWQAMRDQWLVDRESLTAQQWAERRLDWFAVRDAWIASQKAWAQARRH